MARHPRVVDGALALVVTWASIASGAVSGSRSAVPAGGVVVVVLALVTGVALMARRTRPVTVLAIAGASAAASAVITGAFDGIVIAVALFAVAVHGSTRRAWLGLGGAAAFYWRRHLAAKRRDPFS